MGPVLVVASMALFLRPQLPSDFLRAAKESRAILFVTGIIALAVGLAIVLVHNVWDGTWRTTITVIGWIIIIKGCVRLLAPEWTLKTAQKGVTNKALVRVVTGTLFIVGLCLAYHGFM